MSRLSLCRARALSLPLSLLFDIYAVFSSVSLSFELGLFQIFFTPLFCNSVARSFKLFCPSTSPFFVHFRGIVFRIPAPPGNLCGRHRSSATFLSSFASNALDDLEQI